MDNSGFAMKFCSRRQALGDYSPLGIVFVDGLEGVANRVMEDWEKVDKETGVQFHSRESFYSDRKGNSVIIEESNPRADTRMDVSSMEFFNHFLKDLEKTIRGYDLPFHKEQVIRR